MKFNLGERPCDHYRIPEEAMTKQVRLALEENYRRGYQQGFFQCMHTPLNLAEDVFKKITGWRFRNHNGRVEWPIFAEKVAVKRGLREYV
jgi:hypothetical protein